MAIVLAGCGGETASSGGPVTLPSPAPTASPTPTSAPVPVNDGYVQAAAAPSLDTALYAKRTFQGLPGIARVGQRIWVVWMGDNKFPGGETTGTYLILSYSDDEGSSWSREFYLVPANPATDRAYDPRLWAAPDGKLWVLYPQVGNGKVHDGQEGAWASIIGNPLNTTPTFEPGFWLADGVPMRPFVYNGEWAIPIDYWFSPTPCFPERAGRNIYTFDWAAQRVSHLTKAPRIKGTDYDESAVIQLKDGNLFSQSRTYSDGIMQSRTSGGRLLWITPTPFTDYPSIGSRNALARSPSGRLVMVFNKSMSTVHRTDMTIALSDDEGRTWPHAHTFDSSLQVSYPDIDFAANGDILVAYDMDRHNHKRILLARFVEQAIVDGSPSVDIKLVNQPAR